MPKIITTTHWDNDKWLDKFAKDWKFSAKYYVLIKKNEKGEWGLQIYCKNYGISVK